MKIKKITILLFFITGIGLLIHNIVPHHHHSQMVCLFNSEPCDDFSDHGDNDTEECFLKQIIIKSNENSLPFIFICCPLFNLDLKTSKELNTQKKPYLFPDYKSCIKAFVKLRAPPVF